MARQPLCSNTSDGPCPCFALNGTSNCLQHTEETGLYDPVDIGYRPGGIGTPGPPPPVDQDALTAAVREYFAQQPTISSTSDWAGPPPPVRRRGWFAGLAAVFR
ncbi:hypothetical protein L3Q65_46010 [Amycolatopsis sp. FU40]|uniref:hypothetical protein n=1 Tax=Amycolatopsis sp. FU40 TaxID=2914159 RepID=UPI001F25838F|nr:hypothetical protein [Amycolatopsis sp. FU40]UKD55130.1 hypothetical protein L3Q65_46010 [Amycolatopsis sp. FU40]